MRKITKTHTGNIISDSDLKLEYLYIGDYGKENNIKASFLGYNKRIDEVKHKDVDLQEKLVVTVSSQKGCPMKCDFCDCHKYGFKGNASLSELISQITTCVSMANVKNGDRLNVHFARMGEPTFNYQVINAANIIAKMKDEVNSDFRFKEYHPVVSTMMPKDNSDLFLFLHTWVSSGKKYGGKDGYGLQFSINTLNEKDRNKMFNDKSLSLSDISKMIKALPAPLGRKYTLNFAVTSKSDLSVDKMNKYFDKDRCVIKITPIHETKIALDNNYEIVKDFDVYEVFEKPLVKDGWDVIVFVPSKEEDSDRITCGNSLIALNV